jgi:AraC family transcriptional regulator, regulatory protein of adaptative response / methylated-DNA-[protein]-cysteine methyltransferase
VIRILPLTRTRAKPNFRAANGGNRVGVPSRSCILRSVNDYDRIAGVIRHMAQSRTNRPSIGELASVVSLSTTHFHRLFHRWAGVTPKDFLQALTVPFARQRLRESASVLDVALDAGLSGPGRLHDLLVALEAASPGEIKRRGAGLEIRWGHADSPFGSCSIGWNPRGICHLAFHDHWKGRAAPDDLLENWAAAEQIRDDRGAQRWAEAIFERTIRGANPLRAFVRGTTFQVKVWRALLRVPPGSLVTYGRIARAIGAPRATRAVGTACGQNPIGWLIPCHRVIRETGVVEGYRWGTDRKRAMIAREQAERPVSMPA